MRPSSSRDLEVAAADAVGRLGNLADRSRQARGDEPHHPAHEQQRDEPEDQQQRPQAVRLREDLADGRDGHEAPAAGRDRRREHHDLLAGARIGRLHADASAGLRRRRDLRESGAVVLGRVGLQRRAPDQRLVRIRDERAGLRDDEPVARVEEAQPADLAVERGQQHVDLGDADESARADQRRRVRRDELAVVEVGLDHDVAHRVLRPRPVVSRRIERRAEPDRAGEPVPVGREAPVGHRAGRLAELRVAAVEGVAGVGDVGAVDRRVAQQEAVQHVDHLGAVARPVARAERRERACDRRVRARRRLERVRLASRQLGTGVVDRRLLGARRARDRDQRQRRDRDRDDGQDHQQQLRADRAGRELHEAGHDGRPPVGTVPPVIGPPRSVLSGCRRVAQRARPRLRRRRSAGLGLRRFAGGRVARPREPGVRRSSASGFVIALWTRLRFGALLRASRAIRMPMPTTTAAPAIPRRAAPLFPSPPLSWLVGGGAGIGCAGGCCCGVPCCRNGLLSAASAAAGAAASARTTIIAARRLMARA
jgi:hypothetical protein